MEFISIIHPYRLIPGGNDNRRKFRSQTSDNIDRWKAEQGRGREKKKIRRKKGKIKSTLRRRSQYFQVISKKKGKSNIRLLTTWKKPLV
jgi:hypothetical protein